MRERYHLQQCRIVVTYWARQTMQQCPVAVWIAFGSSRWNFSPKYSNSFTRRQEQLEQNRCTSRSKVFCTSFLSLLTSRFWSIMKNICDKKQRNTAKNGNNIHRVTIYIFPHILYKNALRESTFAMQYCFGAYPADTPFVIECYTFTRASVPTSTTLRYLFSENGK